MPKKKKNEEGVRRMTIFFSLELRRPRSARLSAARWTAALSWWRLFNINIEKTAVRL